MDDEEFIVLEFATDMATRQSAAEQRGGLEGLSASGEILVSRPPDMPLSDYVKVTTTNDPKAADDARDTPGVLTGRVMPVALIRPASQDGTGPRDEVSGDPLAAAKAAGLSWGIADVLGPDPRDVDGSGVKVAVLDTGIDPNHPAFVGVRDGIIAARKNFTAGGDDDGNGHGTHCAGTIFGGDVDDVRIGAARGVSDILIGKVLDDFGRGSTKSIIDGLKWAHSEGANIISMSLGLDFPGMQKRLMQSGRPPEIATSTALVAYRDALVQFQSMALLLMQETQNLAGTVIVAAAGNESRRQISPTFTIAASLPASADISILSVAATRVAPDGRRPGDFSNVDPALAAPGVDIVSAAAGGGLRPDDGTSMAAPHVTGAAALWWAYIAARDGGYVRASDVRSALTHTADANGFSPGVSRRDRGAGSVRAPQNDEGSRG